MLDAGECWDFRRYTDPYFYIISLIDKNKIAAYRVIKVFPKV